MKHALAALLILCAPISGEASAQIVSAGNAGTMIGPWKHGAQITPSAGGSVLYGAFDLDANWTIAQWGNPVSDLGPFASVACAGNFSGFTNCWQATSPNITDTFGIDGSGNQWEENYAAGTNLPCSPAAGAELDSNLAANGTTYPNYPTAVFTTANLGKISHLVVSVTANPVSLGAVGSGCSTHHENMNIIVVLSNPSHGQTLYYQITLQGYNNTTGSEWWASSNPFGYRDHIKVYNGGQWPSGIPLATNTSVTIDLMTRIPTIFAGAPGGFDQTLADWNTQYAYLGNQVFGNDYGDTLWSGFSFVGT